MIKIVEALLYAFVDVRATFTIRVMIRSGEQAMKLPFSHILHKAQSRVTARKDSFANVS
jgi:hypothetical protein